METTGPWEAIRRVSRSHLIRVVQIVFLILLMQVPISMVQRVIEERSSTRDQAVSEVTSKWGGRQIVSGPKIVVPYLKRIEETNVKDVWWGKTPVKEERTVREYAYFLPETLGIVGSVTSEVRNRGIYDVPVYQTDLRIKGSFVKPDFSGWEIVPEDVVWDGSFAVLGVSDVGSIQEHVQMAWNDTTLDFEPGTGESPGEGNGIHAPLGALANVPGASFTFTLSLNGSGGVYFAPLGRQTVVVLICDWPSPSFQGEWLPSERTLGLPGFEAEWDIPFLGRNTPQRWLAAGGAPAPPTFGVDLITPIDEYRMAHRSVKYAVLFLCLTLGTLWLFEVLVGLRVHAVQYLLVGAALCLFYLLELSLSEHLGFALAYVLASLSVVGVVAAYTSTVLHQTRRAIVVGGVLAALFVYLYVVLRIQDYALLLGSLGLFVALCTVMYLTRHVDWFSGRRE